MPPFISPPKTSYELYEPIYNRDFTVFCNKTEKAIGLKGLRHAILESFYKAKSVFVST